MTKYPVKPEKIKEIRVITSDDWWTILFYFINSDEKGGEVVTFTRRKDGKLETYSDDIR